MSVPDALKLAWRLTDPCTVLAAVRDSDGASLSSGTAGTALLHARLACADPAFEAAAVRHWTAAADLARRQRDTSAGIFHSPGGLAASLIIGSAYLTEPSSQHRSVMRVARWLSRRALDLAREHQERMRAGQPPASWAAYDVISGLSGIGRVLLAAATTLDPATWQPGLAAALKALTAMIGTRRGTRPGWWLPPAACPPSASPPKTGVASTGMAHGIAGPLAMLSAACLAGQEVPGQRAAIRAAAQWLLRWQDPASRAWPAFVTGAELDTGTPAPRLGRRDAWCYGTPGISRALTLAGHALGDTLVTASAASAIASMCSRPTAEWDVTGPGLCHGYAGVLQCATGHRMIAPTAASAIATALANEPDSLGLLTGSTGIALALADYSGMPAPVVPARWDSVLLIT